MTIRELLALSQKALQKSDSPRLDAELAATLALSCQRSDILIHPDKEVSAEEEKRMEAIVERRAKGEPMAYILGKKEFFGRDFAVTKDTLIPRPDTETLVEATLEAMDGRESLLFADLGAGSGCVGISLCLERPKWRGILLEKSAAACQVAALNAKTLGATNVLILQADFFSLPFFPASLDFIVSNPPYIALDDPNVMDDVRSFEPASALFSEDSGLAHLKAATEQSSRCLKEGGFLAFEHGYSQGQNVRKMLSNKGFFKINTKKDLAGLDRISFGAYIGRRCC